MDPVLFQIGNYEIKWYSFLILVGMLVGIFLIIKEATKFNIKKDSIFNMCFYAIIFGILGARLYYVLFNISYYKYKKMLKEHSKQREVESPDAAQTMLSTITNDKNNHDNNFVY